MNYTANEVHMRSDGKEDRRLKQRTGRGDEDDEAVDVNDVQFENQVDYDDDVDDTEENYNPGYQQQRGPKQSNPQYSSGVSGLTQPTNGVSGKANRIGAYRKSNTFEQEQPGERSTEGRRRHTGQTAKSPAMEREDPDESFTSPGAGGPDVKMAIQNLQETQQVGNLMDQIEVNFCKSKKKINGLDIVTLESDITAQTLTTCYQVINNSVGPENPNFDTEKMSTRLEQMLQRVRNSNNEYNRFKGEFFSINEPLINKDILTLNLDRVERYMEKQEMVLNKLPPQEDLVKENASQIAVLKKKYQAFEGQLFAKQVEETRYVIKDTDDLIDKIEGQEENLKHLIEQASSNLQTVLPQTKDHRAKYQKIQQDLLSVEQKIDDSIYSLNQELKNKDDLDGRHAESEKILSQIGPVDLIYMVAQSREMKKLVETHCKWVELYKRLKQMQDEEINNLEFFIQKAIQNAKKFQESVNSDKKEEYDDIIRKIQKIAKKVLDEDDEQMARLESFENKVVKPHTENPHIADVDMIFLKKEISRNRSALEVVKNMTEDIIDDAQNLRDESARGTDRLISVSELQQLREDYKALQKLDSIDTPRIKKNIDMLEGFSVKSLKNQLNDDNKKSQAMISSMKKNFEDLQRQIEKLNAKVVTSSQAVINLKNNFGNDDLERENEYVRLLDDKLEACNRDINGERADSVRGDSDRNQDSKLDKLKSLQSRKRTIIGLINKMVNQFNENNKLIKDANKVAKNEKEMSDLIVKNKEIQDDCNKIADQIQQGKVFAGEINERLDNLLDPNLSQLKDKYNTKNAVIDECDEVFDAASAQISNQEAVIAEELEKMKQIIGRLDTVNPVNNPSVPGKENQKFYKELAPKLDLAYQLQDELEAMKDNLGKGHTSLINMVQPLNELGEREVKQPEIDDILKKLNNMNKDLNAMQRDIQPKKTAIEALMGDVESMLERDKGRKVDEAEQLLNDLDDQIDDLALKREDLFKKLGEYKNLIAQAKGREGRDDPELMGRLKELEGEAKAIEREINDVDNKMNEMKKKRNDSKKLLDEIKKQPNKFTPSQIEQLLMTLNDNQDKQINLNEKADHQEDDLDQRLVELNALLDSSSKRKRLQNDIDSMTKQMKDDFDSFNSVLADTPKKIDMMLKTLVEMKIGAEPDESADYWEERKTIDQQINQLKKVKSKLEQLDKVCQKKKIEFDQLQASSKKSLDTRDLENYARDLKKASIDLQEQVNSAFDARDEVNEIKKDMADCDIPVNIQVRRNEVQAYLERLERIKMDFRDLKQADEDFDGESGSEREIKQMIKQIDQQIRSYDQEGRELTKYQNQKLDMYREQDFVAYNIYYIIVEVREFKQRVYDSTLKLKDIEDLMNELNSKLIQQDMDNATVLLTKKAQKLRERLIAAQKGLKKIHNCGNEMDGNTTHNEEDEFIDALKDEMPDVFKNIDLNFEQIDGIDVLLKQVIDTRNIEKMALLKKEIDDANNKVEQSEGLVVKLENEIVEWNAFKKLCRRDEELAEIDALLKDFTDDLQEELQLMDKELQKNNAKVEKDGDPKGILVQQRNGLINYMDEIEELMKFIIQLKEEKDICFREFNDDLPRMVKEARVKRQQMSQTMGSPNGRKKGFNIGKGIDMGITDSDKPNDIYYMITINCRYRKRIHELLKELRNINQRRRELEDKYASLKRDLSAIKATKAYKPMKGDPIDELFAHHLNKCGCTLQVKRLAPGKYLFGTRQILAKIINGKLVIRVGGGYMSADEFIEQYGRQEMMKMMKDQESKSNDGMSGRNAGSGKMDGKPAAGIGDMRDMMRNQLMNVKLYEHQGSADALIGGNRRSNVKGTHQVSLNQLEGNYKMATITKAGMSPAPTRSKLDMNVGSPKREKGYMNRTTSNDQFDKRISSPQIRR